MINKINKNIIYGFLSGIISSILLSFTPLIYIEIINKILKNDINDISYLLINYFLFIISSNFFAGIRGLIFTLYMEELTHIIKDDIIKTYKKKSLLFFNKNSHQNIANILNEDAKSITELYYTNGNIFLRDLAQFIITSLILLNKSVILYLITILLSLTHLFLEYKYNKFFFDVMIDKSGKMLIEQNNLINDYIHKIDTYKTLNIDIYEKWKNDNLNYVKLRKKEGIFHGIRLLIFQSIDEVFTLLLIIIGINLKINNNILFVFISYNKSLFYIAKNFNEIRLSIIRKRISLNNINNFFKDDDNIISNGTYIPLNIIPDIRIKNLNFSYDNNKIFNNLNLYIPNNIITGISGYSGKGKSTLLKILLRLYSYEGEILIDNTNIKDIDYNYYYNNLISYVGQEPILYSGTIYENLISNLEEKDIDKELLEKILDKLDISKLDNINLSGGEKQRLNICRAFLRKPKILLLDEPTSSLDYKNENNVLNLIKELNDIYKITIILVSHSNSAISICDNIIKLF
jgi:ABC-type multidrug transport system fused ATPase/permease subunit